MNSPFEMLKENKSLNFSRYNRKWWSYRLLRLRKSVCQWALNKNSNGDQVVLFIIGCQRSGTTLMTEIMEKDFNIKVYGEYSTISAQGLHKIRLNPLNVVKKEIEKNKVSNIVVKPLVETQNALKLLAYFPHSKAVWMYRHYKDVVSSNLKHWGEQNGINNLRPIVNHEPQNWRSEKVSQYTREVVMKYFGENMNPYDAAALFWWARNRLFFELDLKNYPAVLMCKYEDLVIDPGKVVRGIYDFMNWECAIDEALLQVHSESKGKGKGIALSEEIDSLCADLLGELNGVYESKYH